MNSFKVGCQACITNLLFGNNLGNARAAINHHVGLEPHLRFSLIVVLHG